MISHSERWTAFAVIALLVSLAGLTPGAHAAGAQPQAARPAALFSVDATDYNGSSTGDGHPVWPLAHPEGGIAVPLEDTTFTSFDAVRASEFDAWPERTTRMGVPAVYITYNNAFQAPLGTSRLANTGLDALFGGSFEAIFYNDAWTAGADVEYLMTAGFRHARSAHAMFSVSGDAVFVAATEPNSMYFSWPGDCTVGSGVRCSGGPSLAAWHHVVFTISQVFLGETGEWDAALMVYLDGNLIIQEDRALSEALLADNYAPLMIGTSITASCSSSACATEECCAADTLTEDAAMASQMITDVNFEEGRAFEGSVNLMRYYDVVLSSDSVSQLYEESLVRTVLCRALAVTSQIRVSYDSLGSGVNGSFYNVGTNATLSCPAYFRLPAGIPSDGIVQCELNTTSRAANWTVDSDSLHRGCRPITRCAPLTEQIDVSGADWARAANCSMVDTYTVGTICQLGCEDPTHGLRRHKTPGATGLMCTRDGFWRVVGMNESTAPLTTSSSWTCEPTCPTFDNPSLVDGATYDCTGNAEEPNIIVPSGRWAQSTVCVASCPSPLSLVGEAVDQCTSEGTWERQSRDCLLQQHTDDDGFPLPAVELGTAALDHAVGLSRSVSGHRLVNSGYLGGEWVTYKAAAAKVSGPFLREVPSRGSRAGNITSLFLTPGEYLIGPQPVVGAALASVDAVTLCMWSFDFDGGYSAIAAGWHSVLGGHLHAYAVSGSVWWSKDLIPETGMGTETPRSTWTHICVVQGPDGVGGDDDVISQFLVTQLYVDGEFRTEERSEIATPLAMSGDSPLVLNAISDIYCDTGARIFEVASVSTTEDREELARSFGCRFVNSYASRWSNGTAYRNARLFPLALSPTQVAHEYAATVGEVTRCAPLLKAFPALAELENRAFCEALNNESSVPFGTRCDFECRELDMLVVGGEVGASVVCGAGGVWIDAVEGELDPPPISASWSCAQACIIPESPMLANGVSVTFDTDVVDALSTPAGAALALGGRLSLSCPSVPAPAEFVLDGPTMSSCQSVDRSTPPSWSPDPRAARCVFQRVVGATTDFPMPIVEMDAWSADEASLPSIDNGAGIGLPGFLIESTGLVEGLWSSVPAEVIGPTGPQSELRRISYADGWGRGALPVPMLNVAPNELFEFFPVSEASSIGAALSGAESITLEAVLYVDGSDNRTDYAKVVMSAGVGPLLGANPKWKWENRTLSGSGRWSFSRNATASAPTGYGWLHVALTVDVGSYSVFLNGTMVGEFLDVESTLRMLGDSSVQFNGVSGARGIDESTSVSEIDTPEERLQRMYTIERLGGASLPIGWNTVRAYVPALSAEEVAQAFATESIRLTSCASLNRTFPASFARVDGLLTSDCDVNGGARAGAVCSLHCSDPSWLVVAEAGGVLSNTLVCSATGEWQDAGGGRLANTSSWRCFPGCIVEPLDFASGIANVWDTSGTDAPTAVLRSTEVAMWCPTLEPGGYVVAFIAQCRPTGGWVPADFFSRRCSFTIPLDVDGIPVPIGELDVAGLVVSGYPTTHPFISHTDEFHSSGLLAGVWTSRHGAPIGVSVISATNRFVWRNGAGPGDMQVLGLQADSHECFVLQPENTRTLGAVLAATSEVSIEVVFYGLVSDGVYSLVSAGLGYGRVIGASPKILWNKALLNAIPGWQVGGPPTARVPTAVNEWIHAVLVITTAANSSDWALYMNGRLVGGIADKPALSLLADGPVVLNGAAALQVADSCKTDVCNGQPCALRHAADLDSHSEREACNVTSELVCGGGLPAVYNLYRVYSRALSAEQVERRYNHTLDRIVSCPSFASSLYPNDPSPPETVPQLARDCDTISLGGTGHAVGTSCGLSCPHGTILRSSFGNSWNRVECHRDGQWWVASGNETVGPADAYHWYCESQCDALESPLLSNGAYVHCDRADMGAGTQCSLSCPEATSFNILGGLTTVCDEAGQWQPDPREARCYLHVPRSANNLPQAAFELDGAAVASDDKDSSSGGLSLPNTGAAGGVWIAEIVTPPARNESRIRLYPGDGVDAPLIPLVVVPSDEVLTMPAGAALAGASSISVELLVRRDMENLPFMVGVGIAGVDGAHVSLIVSNVGGVRAWAEPASRTFDDTDGATWAHMVLVVEGAIGGGSFVSYYENGVAAANPMPSPTLEFLGDSEITIGGLQILRCVPACASDLERSDVATPQQRSALDATVRPISYQTGERIDFALLRVYTEALDEDDVGRLYAEALPRIRDTSCQVDDLPGGVLPTCFGQSCMLECPAGFTLMDTRTRYEFNASVEARCVAGAMANRWMYTSQDSGDVSADDLTCEASLCVGNAPQPPPRGTLACPAVPVAGDTCRVMCDEFHTVQCDTSQGGAQACDRISCAHGHWVDRLDIRCVRVAPREPQMLEVSSCDSSMFVTWRAPAAQPGDPTPEKYFLEWQQSGSPTLFEDEVAADALPLRATLRSLPVGAEFDISVVAVSESGEVGPPARVSARVSDEYCSFFQVSAATSGDGTVRLSSQRPSVPVVVALPQAPAAGETVVVACATSDTLAAELQPGSVTFTQDNWDTPQSLMLSAVADGDNGDAANTELCVACRACSSSGPPTSVCSAPQSCSIDENVKQTDTTLVFATAPDVLLEAVLVESVWPYFENALVHVPTGDGTWSTISSVSTTSSSNAKAFLLTLNGGDNITLLGDSSNYLSRGPHFTPDVTVTIGGVAADVRYVEPGGTRVNLIAPSFAEVCNSTTSTSSRCAHTLPIVISNGNIGEIAAAIDPAFTGLVGAIGQTVACPPSCPGNRRGGGVLYASACIGFAGSAECSSLSASTLVGGSALDASVARSCAFGEADTCRMCPDGAVCPGGNRAWPLAGFWTDDPADPQALVRCGPPAKERCAGWDIDVDAPVCGDGYEGFACSLCALKYYEDSDGACIRCPDEGATAAMARRLGALVFGGFLLFVSVLVVVVAVARIRGGTVAGGAQRSAQFVVWVATVAQVVSQVGKGATPGVPSYLRELYTMVDVLSFDFGLAHPSCVDGYPFFNEVTAMSGACGVTLLCILLSLKRARIESCLRKDSRRERFMRNKLTPVLRRGLFMIMSVIYPFITNTAVSLLHCVPPEGSGDDGGRYLASNRHIECFVGPHLSASIVAAATLAVASVSFPLWSLGYVFHMRDVAGTSKRKKTVLAAFLDNDYKPKYFWVRHVQFFTVLILGVLVAVYQTSTMTTTEASAKFGISAVCLVAYTVLLLYKRPFLDADAWKLPVKVLSLVVAILAATTNYADFMRLSGVAGGGALPDETAQLDADEGSTLGLVIVALALATAVLSALLVVVLVWAFFKTLWRNAAKEQRRIVRRRRKTLAKFARHQAFDRRGRRAARRRKGAQADTSTSSSDSDSSGSGEANDKALMMNPMLRASGTIGVAKRTARPSLSGGVAEGHAGASGRTARGGPPKSLQRIPSALRGAARQRAGFAPALAGGAPRSGSITIDAPSTNAATAAAAAALHQGRNNAHYRGRGARRPRQSRPPSKPSNGRRLTFSVFGGGESAATGEGPRVAGRERHNPLARTRVARGARTSTVQRNRRITFSKLDDVAEGSAVPGSLRPARRSVRNPLYKSRR